MGYDLYLDQPTPEMLAIRDERHRDFMARVRQRDDYRVETLLARCPDLLVPSLEPADDPLGLGGASPLSERGPIRLADAPDLRIALASAEANQAWRDLLTNDPTVAAEFERRQDAVGETYASEDPTYFRWNISGMSHAVDLMEAAGMIDWTRPPDWPDEPEGVGQVWLRWADGETVPALPGEPGAWNENDPADPAQIAFSALHEAVLAFPPQGSGIAGAKFASNDNWHVTESECSSALAIWERLAPEARRAIRAEADGADAVPSDPAAPYLPDPASYWDSWLAFIARASEHGGFRVR